MLENFSLAARRVVFWSRVEASRNGGDRITCEHLLAGYIGEELGGPEIAGLAGTGDRSGRADAMGREAAFLDRELAERIRGEIPFARSEKSITTSADMPLDECARKALTSVAFPGEKNVSALQVLLAVVQASEGVRALLEANGVTEKALADEAERRRGAA